MQTTNAEIQLASPDFNVLYEATACSSSVSMCLVTDCSGKEICVIIQN
jgi:hypothetical protein